MLASAASRLALNHLLFGASLVLGACAGRSSSHADGDGGSTASGATGGASSGTGGTSDPGKGGTGVGGTSDPGKGGTGVGGTSDPGKGGTGVGGTSDPGKGGTGVGGTSDPGKGGTGGMPSCENVSCPSIPNSCKKLVQPPDECCPVCLDTGCDVACDDPACKDGQHLETIPGDCCPTCVADPPDACATGQALYADLKEALVEKYGATSCKNSTECSVVYESNACVSTCGIALPTSTAQSYVSNLDNYAAGCSTCPPPLANPCPAAVAACVNGKCVLTGP